MISGYIVGDRQLIARMSAMPDDLRRGVEQTVKALGFELQSRVQVQKLTGQVLKVRTGRLKRSISPSAGADSRSRYEQQGDASYYYVGTNVSYGAAWEYGAKACDIVPVKAKALRFEINGQVFFRKRVHKPAQAARPFLAPALQEMRPMIEEQLAAVLKRVATQGMQGR